jgi:CCR4-NOT transcriptional regulation complex NOT5 subunit
MIKSKRIGSSDVKDKDPLLEARKLIKPKCNSSKFAKKKPKARRIPKKVWRGTTKAEPPQQGQGSSRHPEPGPSKRAPEWTALSK